MGERARNHASIYSQIWAYWKIIVDSLITFFLKIGGSKKKMNVDDTRTIKPFLDFSILHFVQQLTRPVYRLRTFITEIIIRVIITIVLIIRKQSSDGEYLSVS